MLFVTEGRSLWVHRGSLDMFVVVRVFLPLRFYVLLIIDSSKSFAAQARLTARCWKNKSMSCFFFVFFFPQWCFSALYRMYVTDHVLISKHVVPSLNDGTQALSYNLAQTVDKKTFAIEVRTRNNLLNSTLHIANQVIQESYTSAPGHK